jgi:hypothetical protein
MNDGGRHAHGGTCRTKKKGGSRRPEFDAIVILAGR